MDSSSKDKFRKSLLHTKQDDFNDSSYDTEIASQSNGGSSTSNDLWKKMTVKDVYQTVGANNNEEGSAEDKKLAKFASTASWIVNWFLLIAKILCFAVSGSKAVLAALADSAVDLVSQFVLSMAERYIARHNPDYPVGRSRLEALSVLACASIMIMVSIEVVQFSILDLVAGIGGKVPVLQMGTVVYVLLILGVVLKLALFIFCKWAQKVLDSDMLEALAEDHLNDVMSNTVAVITAAVAFQIPRVWWFDPAGALFISIVIIYRWFTIMHEQVKKIVGYTAPPEFIQQVETIAIEHDHRLAVDCTRAYHFGARYNVEMEVVLPGSMTVMESHDIALALQHKIESLSDVERAFVHVDHQGRDGLEHKIERHLVTGITSPLYQIQINALNVSTVPNSGNGNGNNNGITSPTSPASPPYSSSSSSVMKGSTAATAAAVTATSAVYTITRLDPPPTHPTNTTAALRSMSPPPHVKSPE